MKKGIIITGIGIATLAGAGTIADSQMNVYTDKVDSFEHVSVEKIKDSGDDVVTFSKTEPKATLTKWNGEASLGISYKGVKGNGNRPLLSNKIEWKQGKTEVHAYPVTINNGKVEGKKKSLVKEAKAQTANIEEGFEFEVVWNEQPESTTIEFQIDGWENFDFFFQPPLTEEEIANDGVRPDNIVNSFAVYHKTKVNHKTGSTNYGTGKFGHIYRLKAIDANGNEKWVDDVSYSNGVITATVDPIWAANAAYPVTVDPTFGFTTAGGSAIGMSSDRWHALIATAPEDGTAQSASGWFTTTSAGRTVKAVITDGSKMILTDGIGGVSGIITNDGNPQEATSVFGTDPAFVTGTVDIGFIANTTGLNAAYDAVASAGLQDTSNSYASPTNPTDASGVSRKYSMYITYTAAGGGGASSQQISDIPIIFN